MFLFGFLEITVQIETGKAKQSQGHENGPLMRLSRGNEQGTIYGAMRPITVGVRSQALAMAGVSGPHRRNRRIAASSCLYFSVI